MTPCEKLGYKVGMQFEMVCANHGHYRKGSVIELIVDDSSEAPLFKGDAGEWFVNLERVKLIGSALEFIDNQIAQLEQQLNDLNQQRREIINRNDLNK